MSDLKTDASLALVTGAGSGIGRATAKRLAARGLTVLCVGRTLETLRETVAQIQTEGGNAEAVTADCSQQEAATAVRTAVGNRRVKVLVFCAASDPVQEFADATRSDFDRVMSLNGRNGWHASSCALWSQQSWAARIDEESRLRAGAPYPGGLCEPGRYEYRHAERLHGELGPPSLLTLDES